MRQNDLGKIGTRWRWLFWETLIIVIGVLIAFAVNDYWSDRQDRQLELQYLKRPIRCQGEPAGRCRTDEHTAELLLEIIEKH